MCGSQAFYGISGFSWPCISTLEKLGYIEPINYYDYRPTAKGIAFLAKLQRRAEAKQLEKACRKYMEDKLGSNELIKEVISILGN